MKNYYLITKEAPKYWKKALKNDRIMIANFEESIYIVNGYNAFKFPAIPYLWDEIARPAFMCEMPADGTAAQYMSGERSPGCAADIANIFNRNREAMNTAAERTPFTMECGNYITRLFKNGHGDVTVINTQYDAMVDFSQVDKLYCNGKLSPVYAENETGFAALLLPIRRPDNMAEIVNNTFAGLLEAMRK